MLLISGMRDNERGLFLFSLELNDKSKMYLSGKIVKFKKLHVEKLLRTLSKLLINDLIYFHVVNIESHRANKHLQHKHR